jgi:uncharacterized iron-regulated membrane protein
MRAVLVAHRYLGIATGALMIMWCLSGIVMIYVPYPRLAERERLDALPPISWSGCCQGVDAALRTGGFDDLRIEMLAGHVVLRESEPRPVDIQSGTVVQDVTVAQAGQVAEGFARPTEPVAHAPAPRLLAVVNDDTWTVSGIRAAERPLYRFALDDRAGTEVYVSSVSGRAVQTTTARQRFWNRFGAIPHWLYFVRLRRNVRLWSAVVISAALAGCFLTVTGLVVGIQQLGAARRIAPARRGLSSVHHFAGIVFGLFAFTWVASGLLSMNPWGLFEGGDDAADRLHLRGPRMPPGRIAASIEAIAQPAAAWKLEEGNAWIRGARSVAAAPLGGQAFFVLQTSTGERLRVDASGRTAPLTQAEILGAATDLAAGARVASVETMTTEDAYFIAHPGERAPLPVIRIILGDKNATRFYLDPLSAEMEAKVDRGARSYRWLYQAFHRLDAWAALRVRPTWDAVVISLVLGVLIVSATGMYLGLSRISSR